MTPARFAIVASLITVVLTPVAAADEAENANLLQPSSVRPTALESDDYVYATAEDTAGDSPSDQPAPADDPGYVAAFEPACCQPDCNRCRRCRDCGLGDPWTLPLPHGLKCRGITAGGWLSAGLIANAHGDARNGPLGYNDLAHGLDVNQLWVFAEKAADTGGYGTDWGARIDYVFGIDGPDEQSFFDGSWDFGWNSSNDYGSAIPQLYLELAHNDLKVKLGHFYTIVGYEVSQAPDNFFYTHAYTMYYGEPVKHTGVLAEYAASDRLTAWGGWTAGWDTGWENLVDASTFLGGLSYGLLDDVTFTWTVSFGDYGTGLGDVYFNSFVLELVLTEKLTYVIQHDLGDNSDRGPANNEWYGVNQYLLYEINDRWSGGLRFEWFRDDDGARVIIGNPGDYYELTAGVNYRPHANLVIRPELRYDWYDGPTPAGQPFDQGNSNEQVSGGFDFIVTY